MEQTHSSFNLNMMQEGYLFDAIWLSTAFLMAKGFSGKISIVQVLK